MFFIITDISHYLKAYFVVLVAGSAGEPIMLNVLDLINPRTGSFAPAARDEPRRKQSQEGERRSLGLRRRPEIVFRARR